MRDGGQAIGVDIGGTRLRAAVVDTTGQVVAREASGRPDTEDPDRFRVLLLDELERLAAALGPGLPIGIGVAALVGRDGRLVAAPNLPAAGMDLARLATDRVGVPVSVANDATVACLAEVRVGAARGVDDVVLVTVGTGIGGGAMIDGRLLRGAGGFAAEFGHMVVEGQGRRCPCGAQGCVEAYASGRAIAARAAQLLADGEGPSVLEQHDRIDGLAVSRAADDGDALACRVIEEAGYWLGVGLADLVNALDPEVVLVGGGAGQAMAERLIPAARRVMEEHVVGTPARKLPALLPAGLGDDAGVVGAALLAMAEQPPR
jgi:glucokinase